MNDFDKTIIKIFCDTPKPDNSIELNLDGISSPKDLFECMMMFLTNGLKYKHGDLHGVVNLNKLTKKEWIDIQQHFRSFNMELFYEKIEIFNKKEYNKHMVDFNKYTNKNVFSDFIFTLYVQPYIYKFSFGFLN